MLFGWKRDGIEKRMLALAMAFFILWSGFIAAPAQAEELSEGSQDQAAVALAAADYDATGIMLSPGRNQTELNFNWYTPRGSAAAAVVQMAEKSLMTGDEFPTEQAMTFTGAVSDAVTGFSSNKVTATGMRASTEYVYRVGDGQNWSQHYDFTTHRFDEYTIMFVGDPQIGSSNVTTDTNGWENTLNKAVEKFPNISFIMSAGDQVNTATSEVEYTGYLKPDVLRSLPVANAVGNHDNSVNYKYHFNQPNESETLGVTNAGGDYYYTYGDALFIVLNSNNMSGATHAQFIKEAVEAEPNTKWRFLTFHHSIYSAANHSTETAIVNLRQALFPVIDEVGFDVVFMGHDHSYVRTYQMKGDIPLKNQAVDEFGRVVNPEGTMYLTANSASGSKYYTLKTTPEVYSDVRSQLRVPTFSTISLTDNVVSISTFRTDTMEEVDTWGMVKDDSIEIPKPELASASLTSDGDTLSADPTKLYGPITLDLVGKDAHGKDMDLYGAAIAYKTNKEGILEVVNGKVTLKSKPAANETVELWAEITYEGKKVATNPVSIHIKHVQESILLPRGSVWKYLDNGSDQGTAWRAPDFDDSSWKSGAAPLGYPVSENRPTFGNVKTVIGYGPNSNAKYPTSYFRTTFTVDDLSKIGDKALIEFGIDDSVVLYLNGHEVGRFNLPAGEIPYDKYVEDYSGSNVADENRFETFVLDAADLAYLKEGVNVLAAEVHQDRPTSSDVYWDMEWISAVEKPMADAPQVKIYAKQGLIVKEENPDANLEFYYAVTEANKLNALDATFQFDETVLKFVKAELAGMTDTVMDASVSGGSVRVAAGFTEPLQLKEYTDVIKLTFELADPASSNLAAEVKLTKSATAASGENQLIMSRIAEDRAVIAVRSYKDAADVNGDGVINIEDLSLALDAYRYTEKDPGWEAVKRADVNLDGVIDMTDFTIIVAQILLAK